MLESVNESKINIPLDESGQAASPKNEDKDHEELFQSCIEPGETRSKSLIDGDSDPEKARRSAAKKEALYLGRHVSQKEKLSSGLIAAGVCFSVLSVLSMPRGRLDSKDFSISFTTALFGVVGVVTTIGGVLLRHSSTVRSRFGLDERDDVEYQRI